MFESCQSGSMCQVVSVRLVQNPVIKYLFKRKSITRIIINQLILLCYSTSPAMAISHHWLEATSASPSGEPGCHWSACSPAVPVSVQHPPPLVSSGHQSVDADCHLSCSLQHVQKLSINTHLQILHVFHWQWPPSRSCLLQHMQTQKVKQQCLRQHTPTHTHAFRHITTTTVLQPHRLCKHKYYNGFYYVRRLLLIQWNPPKWMALGPDNEAEYPLIHISYFTLCLNGSKQMISI